MSPVPNQHEIARHGVVVWSSDAPDAGPYRIGSPWFVLASFGERIPEAAVPGHDRQLEAFYCSRATFHAIRDLTDGRRIDERPVRVASRAARDLARSLRNGRQKVDVDDFEAEVREKLARVLEAGR